MQPDIRITRAEVETLGGFLMAARGAIAIRHPAAAMSAIDAARAILDRVSGEQDDPPAAELPPAQPVVDAQTPVSAPHAYPLALASEQWQRPDDETRAQLLSASLTSASDTETHDRAAQLAFALSLSREAYLEAHPMASWDDEHPSFLTDSPLQGFFRLFLRIFERGLREGEVVLERQTEGRITGLVVFAEVHGRRVGHTVVQLLGFASRARLGEHLHRELVRDVRRRHPPPITLRLEVANCISELSWFYVANGWEGDGSAGGQLLLELEEVPRPRGRAPAKKEWSARLGEWVAGREEVEEKEEEEVEEAAVVAETLTALDYLVIALAEGSLVLDTLLARAAALGCNCKDIQLYVAPAQRARDGVITKCRNTFQLTAKGRRRARDLPPLVTLPEPVTATVAATTTPAREKKRQREALEDPDALIFHRPRGRAPNGTNGEPKRWSTQRGAWEEAEGGSV